MNGQGDSTSNKPMVAVVLVNWNGHEDTVRCIGSLKEASYPRLEIFVVDNGSEPRSVDFVARHHPDVVLIKLETNTGFTGGNNTGIRIALEKGCDIIVLLNNDTVVEPDFLEPLVEALADPSVGAVQPKIFFLSDKARIWNGGGHYNRVFSLSLTKGVGAVDGDRFADRSESDWLTGCCMAVRADVINKVGVLDDRYFAYFEDVDWSFRMKAKGYSLVFEPRSRIYHAVGSSSKRGGQGEGALSPKAIYFNVRNQLIFVRSYSAGGWLLTSYLYQLAKIVTYLTYFALRGRTKKLKAVLSGVRDGMRD